MNRDQATIYRRRNIGIVYQKYNLIQMLNVYENIVFPIEMDGNKPDYKYIDEILDTLGLKDKKIVKSTHYLAVNNKESQLLGL